MDGKTNLTLSKEDWTEFVVFERYVSYNFFFFIYISIPIEIKAC